MVQRQGLRVLVHGGAAQQRALELDEAQALDLLPVLRAAHAHARRIALLATGRQMLDAACNEVAVEALARMRAQLAFPRLAVAAELELVVRHGVEAERAAMRVLER